MPIIALVLVAKLCLASTQDGDLEPHAATPKHTTHAPKINELVLHDDHVFELTNIHRPGAVLRWSVRGPNITGAPVHQPETLWKVKLSDHSVFTADHIWEEKGFFSEYHLSWTGPKHNLDREICFHYGFNNVSW